MKEKEGVYKRYAVLEDVGGENGRIHKNLANLDLDITKDVNVSYFRGNNKNEHKTEKISFKEFQYRMLNNQEFIEHVFEIVVEGEDYEIRLSGGEIWVKSFDKEKADSTFKTLINRSKLTQHINK
tara:strand:+ start:201 stop:575 length:375 start_codon:yes stop_codon:yes gene_type:complete